MTTHGKPKGRTIKEMREARAEQARDMYQAYLRGLTLTEVGALYGLGPERVRQVFFQERLPTRQRGWRPPSHPERGTYLAGQS